MKGNLVMELLDREDFKPGPGEIKELLGAASFSPLKPTKISILGVGRVGVIPSEAVEALRELASIDAPAGEDSAIDRVGREIEDTRELAGRVNKLERLMTLAYGESLPPGFRRIYYSQPYYPGRE